jgi:hypothetical protein
MQWYSIAVGRCPTLRRHTAAFFLLVYPDQAGHEEFFSRQIMNTYYQE